MRIQRSSQQECVVLTLAGRLDPGTAPRLQRVILKQLAEQPPAIICDLSRVQAIDPLCAGVFTSIRHPALGWPGTALILCGTQPAVAEILLQLGVAPRLAMYPSLHQALVNARARPPRVGERLALGPVPTAARAVRAFVREVCDRWGLQELVESAGLRASELVTSAVVRAGTAAELRIELRGARLQVAVHDQDPDLLGFLAAKDGTDRRLSLAIVDQVARGQAGVQAKLCLLAAPAGSGKTTLLGQWRAAAGGERVALDVAGRGR